MSLIENPTPKWSDISYLLWKEAEGYIKDENKRETKKMAPNNSLKVI